MTEIASNSNAGGKKEKSPEFNPRWKGYVYIALTSLVNFCSISNIPRGDRQTYWAASMTFGLLTFALAVLVLIQDRSQKFLETFHYTKAYKGYFEGYTLLFMAIWWIVGTCYTTRAGGIAYVANNIYWSSWFSLFSCIYTLNEWSASKDILSIAELTGISATLKSWWLVLLSSIVTLGTCVDLHVLLDEENLDDTSFGVALGVVSTIVSLFFILVHYDFISACEEGGWLELSSSFFLIMLWTIGLAVLTQDQGIAATLAGSQCFRDPRLGSQNENCTIITYGENEDGITEQSSMLCSELQIPRPVPGSNLYFSAWACFFASLNVTFRWKAAQALQFAQAQQEEEERSLEDKDQADGDYSQSDLDEDNDNDI